MGLIRGGLVTILGFVLFLSFILGNVFLTLEWSLEYDVIKPELKQVVMEIANSEININDFVENNLGLMQTYCVNNTGPYVFSEKDYTFSIPCDIVSRGSEAVINQAVDDIVEKVYYKDYNCNFWNCFKTAEKEQPFFLVSETAYDYWNSKFYGTLVLSILLIVVMFFIIELKTNLPIVVGALLSVSSLPFLKLDLFASWIAGDSKIFQFLNVFFTKSYNVFLIMFIAGMIILGIGIALKFWKVGNWLAELFSKYKDKNSDSKKVVIVKEKKK